MSQNFGDQGYRPRLSCHWDKNIRSPFRGGIRERTSFHRTKRSGQQKKHRKSGIKMGMVIPLIPTLYGARAVSIIDRLRIRECKSWLLNCNQLLVVSVFQTANPFLLTEVGKVDRVLCLTFWALGANVTDCVRIYLHNRKIAARAAYFPKRQPGCLRG